MAKHILLSIIAAFVLCACSYAQPIPLGWNVNAEVFSAAPQHYHMNIKEQDQSVSGYIHENVRTRLGAGYLYKVGRPLNIGLSGRYEYNNEQVSGVPSELMMWNEEHHTFKANANIVLYALLFKKPIITFGNVSAEASTWGMERVSGLAASVWMLKLSKETQFGVGGLVLFNTTSQWPFIPFALYRHVYNPRWTLNFNYPFFSMQYTPRKEHTIAAGFTFDSYGYWLHPISEDFPETVYYRRSLLRTGLNYDWRMTKCFTLTLQSGWEYTMNGGFFTANGKEQLYKMKHPNGLYAQLGLRFRPNRPSMKSAGEEGGKK